MADFSFMLPPALNTSDVVVDLAASSSSARFFGNREDSLVFLLGVLNLGTVLCYSVYSQFVKSAKRTPSMSDEYLLKKVQSILDELVLHVHTTNYYKNAINQEERRSFAGRSLELDNYQAPIISKPEEPRSSRKVVSFFDLPDDHEPFQVVKEATPIQLQPSRIESSRKSRLLQVFTDSYRTYLEQEQYKLMEDWVYLVGITPSVRMKRSAAVQSPRKRPRSGRRGKGRAAGLVARKRSSARSKALQVGEKQFKTAAANTPISIQSSTLSTAVVKEHVANKLDSKTLPARGKLDITQAQPRNGNSPQDSDPSPAIYRPLVNNQRPIPAPVINYSGNKETLAPQNSKYKPVSIPEPPRKDGSEAEDPEEDQGVITKLMRLVTLTTPATLDVLNVFRKKDGKCTEVLLCQVNQDLKRKGTVPAALTPFLSVLLGWWLEGGGNPSLPQVLMAVRAGWIGKNCASLYPRCNSYYEHAMWSLSDLHLPEVNTRTQEENLSQEPQDHMRYSPSVTLAHEKPPSESMSLHTPLSYANLPPTTLNEKEKPAILPVQEQNHPTVPAESNWDRVEDSEPAAANTWQQTEPTGAANGALVGASLQVSTNAQSKGSEQHDNSEVQEDYQRNPWGKPSRLDSDMELSLSEIIRGVYPVNVGQKEPQVMFQGQPFIAGDSNDPQVKDVDSQAYSPNMLHDLTQQQFNKESNNTKVDAINLPTDEHETPKDAAVPPTVPPWLASPTWAKDEHANAYSHEADFDANLDTRNRVPFFFTPDDAVKDIRRHEQVLQYIRDRST